MPTESSVTASLESRLESVEEFEEMVRNFSREAGFEEEDQYFLALAAREIVINAIKHGNRFDASKKVEVQLAIEGGRLVIEVRDQGDGFRLEEVPDPHAPENLHRHSGRGVAMAIGIMDEFFVDKNRPTGTHVRMSKSLPGS